MAPKGVCVLKSEKVNGVVKFEQEVRSHDLVFLLMITSGYISIIILPSEM